MHIALILPPREHFRTADAGAVALTVRDFVAASRFVPEITVFGGDEEHFPEVRYQHVPTPDAWFLGKNLAYARGCIKLLRDSSTQLVEVHNRVYLALRIKEALPHLQVTLHLHNDPQGMDGAKTVLERNRLLQKLDALYCVSDYVRRRLLEGTKPELKTPAYTLHNAIVGSTAEATLPRQQWIIYAGRFIPEKGVLELAEALAEVLPKFPEWRAVFLGAWGFGHTAGRSKYEQQVYGALEAVKEQVEFRGHVAHSEVIKAFQQASIAVATSTGIDAFPRAPIEAMSEGCAVLVSTMGGLPEIGGDAAIVMPVVNSQTLATELTALLADPVRTAEVAARCRLRANTEFVLPVLVQKQDDIREQLLQGA